MEHGARCPGGQSEAGLMHYNGRNGAAVDDVFRAGDCPARGETRKRRGLPFLRLAAGQSECRRAESIKPLCSGLVVGARRSSPISPTSLTAGILSTQPGETLTTRTPFGLTSWTGPCCSSRAPPLRPHTRLSTRAAATAVGSR